VLVALRPAVKGGRGLDPEAPKRFGQGGQALRRHKLVIERRLYGAV